MTVRITEQRRIRLSFLAKHPGSSRADIDRSVRTAQGGHQWTYKAVKRDIRDGLVTRLCGPIPAGRGIPLALTAEGLSAINT